MALAYPEIVLSTRATRNARITVAKMKAVTAWMVMRFRARRVVVETSAAEYPVEACTER
jgi:hypothetical protein